MSTLHEDLSELAALCESEGDSVKVRMAGPLFNELYALEVETGGIGSQESKDFNAAMKAAKRSGKGYVLQVSPGALKYMLMRNGPLHQHTDIWSDSDEPEAKAALRAAKALYKKLSAAHP